LNCTTPAAKEQLATLKHTRAVEKEHLATLHYTFAAAKRHLATLHYTSAVAKIHLVPLQCRLVATESPSAAWNKAAYLFREVSDLSEQTMKSGGIFPSILCPQDCRYRC
jgi:hypothetical protein